MSAYVSLALRKTLAMISIISCYNSESYLSYLIKCFAFYEAASTAFCISVKVYPMGGNLKFRSTHANLGVMSLGKTGFISGKTYSGSHWKEHYRILLPALNATRLQSDTVGCNRDTCTGLPLFVVGWLKRRPIYLALCPKSSKLMNSRTS